ncbi:hypothetical protein L6R29_20260 [Myxococcota bacterium]|nr:hypothetical protein [Myxococcota bacterium]
MERVWRLRGWLFVIGVWAVVAVGCRCDGGPPTESSAEGVGEERDGDSGVSKDGIEGVSEGANESPVDGVAGEPRACTHPCDCKQGEGCEGGVCNQVAVAVYCCDKAGCVVGEACRSPRTGSGICGEAGRVCKSVCDCAVGLSCEGGQCSKLGQKVVCCSRPEECKQGACQRSDGSLGVCGEKPACQKTCDCPQGEACVQGRCVGGESPVYCCSKAGCPAGAACKTPDDSDGKCAPAPACIKDRDCGISGCEQGPQGCAEVLARCVDAKCDVQRTPKKGGCDKDAGKCVEGPACQKDQDCPTRPCQQIGKLCEKSDGRCIGGVCVTKTTQDVGLCGLGTGLCAPPQSCATLCDCPQGQYCVEGKCFKSSFPGYCCENPGCPGGATCYTSASAAGKCPLLCVSPCDCPEGYDCSNGKCFRGPAPMYCCDNAQGCPPTATCKDKTGSVAICPQRPRPCRSACDCVQGEACTGGQCKTSAQPAFCCDKEGCPQGQGCENKTMQSGFCPAPCNTLCDCPQGATCINGLCNQDPGLGGAYCCSNAGCPLDQFCYQANGQVGQCAARRCQSPCDCAQGEDCRSGICLTTSPPVYCCGQSGCPQGERCRNASNQWATCTPQSTCASPCDCPQGDDCYRGQCIGTFPAVYCCDKVGCPQGQACFNAQNQAALCPTASCQSACDCPNQGQSCVRGRCTIVTSGSRIYCCDKPFCPPGNRCEDAQGQLAYCSQQSCLNACDCNQGEDCQNGVCVYVQPPVLCCSKPFCQPNAPCVRPDGTQSACGRP